METRLKPHGTAAVQSREGADLQLFVTQQQQPRPFTASCKVMKTWDKKNPHKTQSMLQPN